MTARNRTFQWDGPAQPEALSDLRRAVQDWGKQAALSAELVSELTLASYEAMANVAEHAYEGGQSGPLSLRINRDDDLVTVTVSDQGRWRFPSIGGAGGRGLVLMEGLAKEVSVTRTEDGTTVRLSWPISSIEPDTAAETDHSTDNEQAVGDRLHDIEAITDTALARLDSDTLAQEMLARVRDLLQVDTASMLLYESTSQHLVVTASSGIEEEVRQGVRIPFGLGFAGTVAAQQRPIIIDRVDRTTVLNPLLWEKGLRALLGVPMLAGGQLIGVLHVGTRRERGFSEQDVSLLQVAADRLALATQAEASRAERAAAIALQRSLLPGRLPFVAGYEIATRYVPSAELGVGGDWYDVFPLPGDRVGVVIGDVAGHGLAAAVIMGRLRSALRAYALDNESPAVVLDKLDRKANHFEAGTMATVAYGVIDLAEHRLRLCLAGHLPPVLAVPGRPTVFVDARPDPPIGFALRARPRRCHTVDLPPGVLVCFYTDGLIERRDQPIDDGLQAVLRTVVAEPPEAACVNLMATFVGVQSLADDVALLAVHRNEV
jgi:serine phosphatase RsbU (regulator of sigma subunit)/anti-sigma regulatory factor (Ser/Thr protein kinase)